MSKKTHPAITCNLGPHLTSEHAIIQIFWTEDGESFNSTPVLYLPELKSTLKDFVPLAESLTCWVKVNAKDKEFTRRLYNLCKKNKAGFLLSEHRGRWVHV